MGDLKPSKIPAPSYNKTTAVRLRHNASGF